MNKSMVEQMESVRLQQLISSEYQRGYLEGQQQAARDMAELIDKMMGRFDHLAIAGKLDTGLHRACV